MATLRTEDLTKSYGGRTVVRSVNLEVSSGEVVGLLGPNGAGKTTTFYMTVGLTAPDRGRVERLCDTLVRYPDRRDPWSPCCASRRGQGFYLRFLQAAGE